MGKVMKKMAAGIKSKRSLALAGGSIAGAGLSAYLAARGQKKADAILANYQNAELTTAEKFKLTWKCYIPAGGALAFSIGCTVGNQYLTGKEIAALGASVGVLAANKGNLEAAMREKYGDEAIDEIKMKLRQGLGVAEKEAEVSKPGKKPKVVYQQVFAEVTGHGNQLFSDEYSGRRFRSSVEHVKWAISAFNMELLENGFATYNDIFGLWGIEQNSFGENHGWINALNYDEDEGVRFMLGDPVYDEKFGETIIYIDNIRDQPFDDIWGKE